MTTFEAATVTLFRRAADRLTARAARRAQRRAAGRTIQAIIPTIRRATLMVAACAGFTVAAWSFDYRLGWAIAGVCALFLEQSFSDD